MMISFPEHFAKVSELGEDGQVSGRLADLYMNNPGLNIQDEADFRDKVTNHLPPQPNAYQEIQKINMTEPLCNS